MARKMTMLGILGILAVVLYVSHVIIGGLLWDEYSHLHRPINDLTASGAPDRGLLSLFTILYGIFRSYFLWEPIIC